MRIILPFLVFIGVIGLVAIVTGFYPVAIVDGSPIFFRDWEKARDAATHFINMQLVAAGDDPIDFSLFDNNELWAQVQRDTLTTLIEQKIISQEGVKSIDGFTTLVFQEYSRAVNSEEDIERGGKLLYGLEFDDFRTIILIPQAQRDVVAYELKRQGREFDSWFAEAKKKKNVSLYFVPFEWDGERVK